MTATTDHLTSRAQRLIEKFELGESVREGIANVLTHLASTWDAYSDEGDLHGVRVALLEDMAEELNAPSLLTRALAGDADAARLVLQEADIIDENGQLRPPYRSEDLID